MNIDLLIANAPQPELLTAPIPKTLNAMPGAIPRIGEKIYLHDLKWQNGEDVYAEVTGVLYGFSQDFPEKIRIKAVLQPAA